jgi:hypothetical protein
MFRLFYFYQYFKYLLFKFIFQDPKKIYNSNVILMLSSKCVSETYFKTSSSYRAVVHYDVDRTGGEGW